MIWWFWNASNRTHTNRRRKYATHRDQCRNEIQLEKAAVF